VSWRRSALSVRGGGDEATGGGAAVSPTGLPQPPQYLAAGSFSKLQAGQGSGSGVPHSTQYRLLAAFSAMHFGQRNSASLRRANQSVLTITERR
jgi:hypothetical protein